MISMADGWISKADRLPGPEDADLQQCVIAWHELNGAMVTGWRQLEKNRFMTHWRPCPPAPEDYPEHYKEMWKKRGNERGTTRQGAG